jgi:preprotein translocase subunit SecF
MIKYRKFNIDFMKRKNIFFGLSILLILIGLLFNIVFGTQMDIKFRGGAIVTYSYTGEGITPEGLEKVVHDTTGLESIVKLSTNIASVTGDSKSNIASIEFSGNNALDIEKQNTLNGEVSKAYPENNVVLASSSSVDPTNGQNFFFKCMCAIALASILMVIYIGIRFRKIGGMSAGVMAVVALLHDAAIIYFTFVVFKMPVDDSFVAVVLTVLGYSLNDTIIIYDRIRENRRLVGPKMSTAGLVNLSINQTLTRTINTTVTTALAITSVLVISIIFNMSSVVTFAFPMLIGVVVGCYSTICIAGPLWVMWKNHKEKQSIAAYKLSNKPKASNTNSLEETMEEPEEKKKKSSLGSEYTPKPVTEKKRGKGSGKPSKRERKK